MHIYLVVVFHSELIEKYSMKLNHFLHVKFKEKNINSESFGLDQLWQIESFIINPKEMMSNNELCVDMINV